jgi:hypothetical protein
MTPHLPLHCAPASLWAESEWVHTSRFSFGRFFALVRGDPNAILNSGRKLFCSIRNTSTFGSQSDYSVQPGLCSSRHAPCEEDSIDGKPQISTGAEFPTEPVPLPMCDTWVYAARTDRIKTPMDEKKQFAVGTAVSIKSSGATGVVILCEDTPTVIGEYWHTVRTDEGEYDHPGSDLEAIDKARSQNA